MLCREGEGTSRIDINMVDLFFMSYTMILHQDAWKVREE
jgi:hypothetical protein